MSEKHKHKDKKRKENGDDEKEAKKAKHDKLDEDAKAEKKDKKDKKKEKKDREKEKEAAGGLMGVPKPTGPGGMGVPKPVNPDGAAVAAATPVAAAAVEQQPEKKKKIKAWQDDELEVDSGDEAAASTKLQTLRRQAARVCLGGGSTDTGEADSLDAYMMDIAKAQDKQQKDKSKEAGSSANPGAPEGMPEGMSVMDATVKTITLEEIMGLMNDGAPTSSSSSSSKPQAAGTEPLIQEVAPATSAAAPEVPAESTEAAGDEEEDDTFHAAFMAQMKKLRETQAVDPDIKDGSDTGEEWDEARTERERIRKEKREAKWKAKDEKADARRKAREARAEKGEGADEEDDDDDDDSEDSHEQKPSHEQAANPNWKDMPKKEKRRLRREQKQKAEEEKEDAKKRMEKMPKGMEESERLDSDAEGSEDSQMEKPQESYFDLVKKYTTKKSLPEVDHTKIDYKAFKKNLYVQVKEITAMKDHEVEDARRTNGDIHVRGKNCPRPIKSFVQCGLPEKVLKILEKRDCIQPFPIQMQAIPALMCGRDIIGVAQTGSGKTLAYLLPLIRHALAQVSSRTGDEGPIGFIVAPTRELALQIQREANVFAKAANMISVCAFGGGPMGEQLSALKKGCEILVGTPGRLIDVLTTSNGKITNLKHVSFLVLDEADRMFDMGFEPQIGMFLQSTRPDKQVAMLSATLPTHVEALARQCLKKPIEITVGERNTAAINVTQYVEVLDEQQKFYRLLQLLGEWHDHGAVIIFVHQQKDVDELFTELLKFGYPALALHGGQDQCDRDFTLQDFKDGVANILVATSVAARGLDVKKVILVVNFKVPDHLEDYIHRIGRTGRAGKPGFAFTFVQPDEGDRAQDMVDALRQCGQEVPEKLKRLTEDFQSQINRGEAQKRRRWGGFGGKGFKYDNTEKSRQQKDRLKAKKESLIGGECASEDEEEFKDAWNEDKPLSAAAQKKQGNDKEKEKPPEPKVEVEESKPKTTGEAAARIAERLKAEVEAKDKAKLGIAPGSSAANAPASNLPSGPQLTAPSMPGAGNGKAAGPIKKTDEELDAEAQAKAEEVLKNLPEDAKGKALPKLKEKLKAQLVKANEAGSSQPAAPGPPKPPAAADSVMEAISSLPGVIGAPTPVGGGSGGELSMIARSIQQIQDGILAGPAQRAREAEAAAAHLMQSSQMQLAPGMHLEELEINDYPQVARQNISKREALQQIQELTGAKVQLKGQYFAPNAKIPDGARQLYVEIIGSTAMSATKAKYEVHKMVEALSIRTLNIPGASRAVMGTPGRYDPAVGK